MRAFYAIAHRCTTPEDVDEALEDGANAIECDIRYYSGDYWVRHDHYATSSETRLSTYLAHLRRVAEEYPDQLALVLLDLKPEGLSGARVATLLERVRTDVTDDTGVNVLLSIGSWSNVSFFSQVRGMLRPREGLAIDEEDRPDDVAEYFASNLVPRSCYGNGIDWLVPDIPIVDDEVDKIDRTLERAVHMKIRRGAFRWSIRGQ